MMVSPHPFRGLGLGLVVGLAACQPGATIGEGIAVGNPGKNSLTTARSTGTTLLSADAALAEVRLVDCAGDTLPVATNIAMGLDGSSSLALPAGSWCGLGLTFDGPAVFRHDLGGGTLELQLDLGDIEATGSGFYVDGDAFVTELGPADWVDPAAWEIAAGETLVVTAVDPEHEALANAVADWLVFARDADGDGTLSTGDDSLATTPAAAPDDDDDDDEEDDEEDDD